ncbi:hypothetical protein [Variovorax sp. J31P207]|uniref:hypothetical protein n=1 Tax=Variovorax sp. J31P207 TaxID=3053510 RepID=UPI002575334B|nr:hypothetical protein [Variovorax sp. J31P207]MDM0068370.1 hypothetical protein [Variovorax sp. J31P207]
MFGAIKHLFQPKRPAAATAAAAAPAPAPAPAPAAPAVESLHWPGTGMFAVAAVDESYYREGIARMARNEPGKAAMMFCTARLVPEALNPHDANAAAVYVGEAKVGHLARDLAVLFRASLARLGHQDAPETTCDAVILNGLVADGEAYEYSVELDLPLDGDAPTLAVPKFHEAVRQDPDPPLRPRAAGLYEVTVWMPHDALDSMDKKQRVESWTTDHWDSINYYLRNRQGIGLGFKVLDVPKALHADLFGDHEPAVNVMAIDGRAVTLLFKRRSGIAG